MFKLIEILLLVVISILQLSLSLTLVSRDREQRARPQPKPETGDMLSSNANESFVTPMQASELRGIMYPPKVGPLNTTLKGAYDSSGHPFAAIYSDSPFIVWSNDPKPTALGT